MSTHIVKVKEHKVADGESIESLAKEAGMTWQELAKLNWGTDVPKEINRFLRSHVGCRKKAKDGINYSFTSKDDPGIIYIPETKEDQFASSSEYTIKVKIPPNKTYITSHCIVKIRPKDDWKGEFGFDWVREADTGISGDNKFDGIVGRYGAKYATDPAAVFTKSLTKFTRLKDNVYNAFNLPWKKDGKDGTLENKVSWLTLFPPDQCKDNAKKCEAKLSLDFEVIDETSEKIRIDYDKQFLELDKEEVTPTSVGKHKMDLTVKCLKEFSSDQEIVFVNETNDKLGNLKEAVAGKLIVIKNDKANRYKAKIVFVKIATKINATANIASVAGEQTFLEKYMYQSLTSLELKEEDLDLKTDAKFNADCVVQKTPTVKAVKNYLDDGTNIHAFLEKKLKDLKPEYNDWYKVFFFNEAGGYIKGDGTYGGLNGAARDIPSKSVVLYNTHNTSTTTHELLHAMGLYHTFDNSGSYTLEIFKTENIMDYSHQKGIDRISTWKWHWDSLHSGLLKE
jgi:hypothetical protein